MSSWKNSNRLLCVRPDNMGDLLMSAPAISAIKERYRCHITLLTSPMAKEISSYIPGVDEVIIWKAPWVQGSEAGTEETLSDVIYELRKRDFDAAVIFTVFSQSPLPTALMLSLAGISRTLAYCRENPYRLLSHWIPEKEPFSMLRHQVKRDLDLVQSIGCAITDSPIVIRLPENHEDAVRQKMSTAGVDPFKPWLILHPGVSEAKRRYPSDLWIEAGKQIVGQLKYQLVVTGTENERAQVENICTGIGEGAFSLAGALSLEELITIIRLSSLLISVNTGTVHLAAAVRTKVIVLYALTNPQHPPWRTIGKVLPFSVNADMQSRNEVLRFVHDTYFGDKKLTVRPDHILRAAYELLIEKTEPLIEELVLPFSDHRAQMRNTLNLNEP
jgi:ADP-heptose:LPS heptosyltransferase